MRVCATYMHTHSICTVHSAHTPRITIINEECRIRVLRNNIIGDRMQSVINMTRQHNGYRQQQQCTIEPKHIFGTGEKFDASRGSCASEIYWYYIHVKIRGKIK